MRKYFAKEFDFLYFLIYIFLMFNFDKHCGVKIECLNTDRVIVQTLCAILSVNNTKTAQKRKSGQNACNKKVIQKAIAAHFLNYSFATHLLESGTDLRYIQELLEFAHTKTTEIYTLVSKPRVANVENPLENITKDEIT